MMLIGASGLISAAHKLPNHPQIHGHTYHVWAYTDDEMTDAEQWKGMVAFACNLLDHTYLNDSLPGEPTMENIARFVCDRIGAVKVRVLRPEGYEAEYTIPSGSLGFPPQ